MKKLKSLLKKFSEYSLNKKNKNIENNSKALLLFENTSEVIKVENLLKKEGYSVKVVGPPPQVRKGCDLAIEIPLVESTGILNFLEKNRIRPLEFLPLTTDNEVLKPAELFHIKDFGDYLMIRAANMKLTVEKKTLKIVNISGGGCPDVPYLASLLIGKTLNEASSLKGFAHTLCGYALFLAYQKAKELLCSE